MIPVLLTLLLLPVIIIAVQWIISDHLDAPSARVKASNRFLLRDLSIIIGVLLIFLMSIRNFLDGRYQLVFSEITLLLIAIATAPMVLKAINNKKKFGEISKLDIEVPEIVAMFTLSISAGESINGTIRYLSQFKNSHTSKIFVEVEKLHLSGYSITQSLDKAAEASHSRAFRKFSDAIALSIERGSPLSTVLINQTTEARSNYKAELLKIAGKAELKLMIPVVFLILPISIIFALLPSLQALSSVV